jgi:hypothetical protein
MDLEVGPHEQAWLATWVGSLAIALLLVVRRPSAHAITRRAYWQALLLPWKLVALLGAITVLAIAAPISGDPTWDLPDSILVSLAVFAVSPHAVGTIARDLAARRVGVTTYVALVLFFVPCWVYEAYILVRDGVYPPTWQTNLVLSGGITLLAGLFFDLGRKDGERSSFAFRWKEWPAAHRTPLVRVLPMAALLTAPVVAMIALFVVVYWLEGGF